MVVVYLVYVVVGVFVGIEVFIVVSMIEFVGWFVVLLYWFYFESIVWFVVINIDINECFDGWFCYLCDIGVWSIDCLLIVNWFVYVCGVVKEVIV